MRRGEERVTKRKNEEEKDRHEESGMFPSLSDDDV